MTETSSDAAASACSKETPETVVEEHKDLFERLAESDLPIAEDAERALELLREAKQ